MNIELMYVDRYKKGDSMKQIADAFNTYPNKVRKILMQHGCKIRDRAEAQANALANGTAKHPTLGKERTQSEKDKIAAKVAGSWSDERKEEKSESQKKIWDDMPDNKRKEFYKKAAMANRAAAEDGSKLEKYIWDGLQKEGYKAEFHKERLIDNEKMHIDIYLSPNIAIEIDGPSHFLPIWGQAALDKKIKSDTYKNGLLLKSGCKIIRVKNMKKSLSKYQMGLVLKEILKCLDKIKTSKEKMFEIPIQ